ncbi:hypothetical protein S245_059454 [Arachis hypogaea]
MSQVLKVKLDWILSSFGYFKVFAISGSPPPPSFFLLFCVDFWFDSAIILAYVSRSILIVSYCFENNCLDSMYFRILFLALFFGCIHSMYITNKILAPMLRVCICLSLELIYGGHKNH